MLRLLLPALLIGSLAVPAAEDNSAPPAGNLRVDRGPGMLALYIPRSESLEFDVEIDIGIADLDVGDVELSSGVDAYVPGLPSATAKAPKNGDDLERGWVRSVATGSYLSYRLEHELKTRILPQTFPALFHTDSQRGSENRNRELKIGVRDGALTAEFRSDAHCKGCTNREHFNEPKWIWGKAEHCRKCKKLEHRAWKDAVSREIPAGTLDMLSAVYLARTLVREDLETTTFPVIDRQKVWEVTLTRGKTRRIKTDSGTFDCQLVQLATSFLAEENDKDEEQNSSTFSGLFGIQGTIQIWLERKTGVPVLIEGELPIPLPLVDKLDVRVRLKRYKNTPAEFKPLPK
ncbi:MAG: DUF3108 domain-containing protein [Planctomycetes bacterium]|nr:DUF3108 domain-containing protein [Planctomycetota bacterium]